MCAVGNEDAMAEWRTQTLKCAKLLGQDVEYRLPKRVADRLHRFMAPLLPPLLPARAGENGERAHEQCREHILNLCISACDLVLLLRSSRDTYRCERPRSDEPIDRNEAEPQDEEDLRKGTDKKHTVIVSLSDTLAKYPEHNPRQKIVLEKAHVIIQS